MALIAADLLEEIKDRLVAEFQPEQIILFGSHAWGEPKDDSDLDLLVIVSDSKVPPARRAARAHRCLRGIPVPADILVKTRAEVDRYRSVVGSLEQAVIARGRVLYG